MKTQLSTTSLVSDIIRLNTTHIEEAAGVLRQAFAHYPITQYMFEGAQSGPDRFGVMFEYLINSRLVQNSPVLGYRIDGELVGVAVLSEPGEGYTTPELDAQWDNASAVMGDVAMERFNKYGDLCDETIPTGPYHYLGILGVLPKCQGAGIGRQLLNEVLEEAQSHPESKGVCLNTEAKQNLPFYNQSGFTVYKGIPVDSIHTWGMVWEKDLDSARLR